MAIEGIKAIKVTGQIDIPDDPSYPFKLEAELRPPEFMQMAFILLYGGSEDVVIRAMTMAALNEFLTTNNLRRHPRLSRLVITGPKGVVEEIKR